MEKLPYRVCEGAHLHLYPRGTKVGDVIHLTEAQALYERDMGRLEVVKAAPVPGETKGYPADAVTGEALDLDAETRARIEAGPDLGPGDGAVSLGQGQASADLSGEPAKGGKGR